MARVEQTRLELYQPALRSSAISATPNRTKFSVGTPSGILQEEVSSMRQCYQRGCLRRTGRKAGPDRWEYLWREKNVTGKRVRRTNVIGTVEQYPTRELAQAVVSGLRMQINEDRLRQPGHDILVAELVDHYMQMELSEGIGWHSHATRLVYRQFLARWIRPNWEKVSIWSVRTIAVERWLRGLQRADGTPLANATKAKIRNLLSVLFNHAIRYEWLGQGENPITLVRQSAKRMRIPEVLEPSEIQGLLLQLKSCFRWMVLLGATTGLRRSELFALKWSDVDFSNMRLDVLRSIYLGHVGDCKTEASRKPVPLDERVAADLWMWKETSRYRQPATGYSRAPGIRGSIRFGQMPCCKRSFARRHCAPGSLGKLGGIPFATHFQRFSSRMEKT